MKKLLVLSVVVASLLFVPIVSAADTSGVCNGVEKALASNPPDSPKFAKALDKAYENNCEYAIEHAALVQFHAEAGGVFGWVDGQYVELWDDLSSDHCGWEGVTCSAGYPGMPDGRVRALVLQGNKLSGSLSGALGELKYISTLNLQYNPNLTGPIPAALMGMGTSTATGKPFSVLLAGTGLGCWETQEAMLWAYGLTYYYPPSPNPACGYETEHGALVDFYHTAGGPSGWDNLLDTDHCGWPGVFCENERVTILKIQGTLQGSLLSGSIPGSLGNLSYLKTLDLASPFLTGPIPAALMDMGSLNPPNGDPFTIDFELTNLGCWETQAAYDWAHQLTYYQAPPSDCCIP